jgi:hypothetical protein
MRVASGGLLLILLCTGCAPAIREVASPAPTPPPTHSIPVAPSPPPPSSAATPTPAPALPPTAPPTSRTVPRPPASPPSAAMPPSPARPSAPTPAPTPTPAPPAAPAPLPGRVLSTGVEDEQRMRRDAQTRIDGAERLVRDIDRKKLAETHQEQSFETIQSFLNKAKEALSAEDPQRAFTLADKAYLLADELSRHLSSR